MSTENLTVALLAGMISIALLINSQVTTNFTSVFSYVGGVIAGVICMCCWHAQFKEDENDGE
jgi:hypothetical protein